MSSRGPQITDGYLSIPEASKDKKADKEGQELQGHITAQSSVLGLVDHTHPTPPSFSVIL
jgi:hypothetical protein